MNRNECLTLAIGILVVLSLGPAKGNVVSLCPPDLSGPSSQFSDTLQRPPYSTTAPYAGDRNKTNVLVGRESERAIPRPNMWAGNIEHSTIFPNAQLPLEQPESVQTCGSSNLVLPDNSKASVPAVDVSVPRSDAESRAPFAADEAGMPSPQTGHFVGIITAIVTIVGMALLMGIVTLAMRRVREADRRLRCVLEEAKIVAWEFSIGAATYAEFGPSEAVLGRTIGAGSTNMSAFTTGVHPDDRDRIESSLQAALRGDSDFNVAYRVEQDDGAVRWLCATATLLHRANGTPSRLVGITRDITERRSRERQMSDKSSRNESILESVPDIIAEVNAEGRYSWVNKAARNFFGDDVIGQDAPHLSHLGDNTDELVTPLEIDCGNSDRFDSWHRRRDGTIRILAWRYARVKENGEVGTRILATARDATEQWRIQKSLEETSLRFLRALNVMSEVIIACQGDGTMSYVSPNVEKLFGHVPADLRGRSILAFVPAPERLKLVNALRETATGKKMSGMCTHLEKADGSLAAIEVDAVPIYENGTVVGCQAIFRDVTEVCRLRQDEERSHRLEAAGQVAGQIAHDFYNLLTPLVAYPDLIREELPSDHPALHYVRVMEDCATKISEINQQLLTLGRRGQNAQDSLNLNDIVVEAIENLGPLPPSLVCQVDLCSDTVSILGGRAQVHRAIMNLLVNAREAVCDAGVISIKTANCLLECPTYYHRDVPAGEYAMITITDTGTGIPNGVVEEMFKPFFTTKSARRHCGSGLGLSIVDAVVKDHGGYVDFDTLVGSGTSFYLYFPASHEPVEQSHNDIIPLGNETVLVVDRNDIQREVVFNMLAGLGYRVSATESGAKAIELLKKAPQDLLVIDADLPGELDGMDTFGLSLFLNSGQRAIFTSALDRRDQSDEIQSAGTCCFVSGLLNRRALALAARQLLDSQAGNVTMLSPHAEVNLAHREVT